MNIDYGSISLIPPVLTIILAAITRQVVLSLVVGVVSGYFILSGFNVGATFENSVQGLVDVFKNDGSAKTIIFGVMVGGIIHLINITGGMASLTYFLCEKSKIIRGPVSTQILGALISGLIFIESNLSLLTSGAIASSLAKKYDIPGEKIAYIIRNVGVSVWSSVMINGWGAAMMGIISVQTGKGYITGEPFDILKKSIVYNIFAWTSIIIVFFSIFYKCKFGAKREIKQRSDERDCSQVEQNDECHSLSSCPYAKGYAVSNMVVPIIAMVVTVPVGLYITGNGNLNSGSGSTAILWSVIVGQIAGFFHYIMVKRVLSVNDYIKELLNGYKTMLPLAVIMTLAFLIGNITGQLNIGGYIASQISHSIPVNLTAAFIFVMAALISLSTGTSWGTFSIMIPIGIQAAMATGVDPYIVIGAAISGSILGDVISPISDTGIVTSLATGTDLINHIRTQLPYCFLAGSLALAAFVFLGFY